MRWLVATSLGCDDATAVASLRELQRTFGSASFDVVANVFDARPSVPCAALAALTSSTVVVGVRSERGFKSRFWRSLTPVLTSTYDIVWLRDSDVSASKHLFSLGEVEHWLRATGAAVAQPSIVPLDGRSKSHGWWTPFRAAFHASCVVASSPIIEQMTPIFTRFAFDAFREKLARVPEPLLWTDSGDFGLETFWCGLFRASTNHSLALPEPASATLTRASTIAATDTWRAAAAPPACIILHHVSVVHMDTRTIDRGRASRTAATHANASSTAAAGGGLRDYLIARWPHAMNASGHPGDVHHKRHQTRCWGVAARPPNGGAGASSRATSRIANGTHATVVRGRSGTRALA